MKPLPIGVIGTLNIEVLLWPLDRIPKSGQQCFVHGFQLRKAGSAPSVGLVLRALGLRPRLFGTVGDDETGRDLCASLKRHGLDLTGVTAVAGQSSGICVSLGDSSGAHRYVTYLGAVGSTTGAWLDRRRKTVLECGAVLLTGYFVLPGLGFACVRRLFRDLRRHGHLVALDTGWDPKGWSPKTRSQLLDLLQHVDVFLPNRDEACRLAGKRDPAAAARFLQAKGPAMVFVKMESQGALLARNGDVCHHAGFPRQVRDTTAAGEAFNAGVLYGLERGWEPCQVLAFANATAARFVESGRADACTLPRIRALLGKTRFGKVASK